MHCKALGRRWALQVADHLEHREIEATRPSRLDFCAGILPSLEQVRPSPVLNHEKSDVARRRCTRGVCGQQPPPVPYELAGLCGVAVALVNLGLKKIDSKTRQGGV